MSGKWIEWIHFIPLKLLALVLLSCGEKKMTNALLCIHEWSQTLVITPKNSKIERLSSNILRTTMMITKSLYIYHIYHIKNGIWISTHKIWTYQRFQDSPIGNFDSPTGLTWNPIDGVPSARVAHLRAEETPDNVTHYSLYTQYIGTEGVGLYNIVNKYNSTKSGRKCYQYFAMLPISPIKQQRLPIPWWARAFTICNRSNVDQTTSIVGTNMTSADVTSLTSLWRELLEHWAWLHSFATFVDKGADMLHHIDSMAVRRDRLNPSEYNNRDRSIIGGITDYDVWAVTRIWAWMIIFGLFTVNGAIDHFQGTRMIKNLFEHIFIFEIPEQL